MASTQIEIDRELRTRIINQTYPCGGRLPTRLELEQEFGVSSNTIQRAVNRLVDDGFAVARGRAGTFAVEHPPHLSRIALMFPGPFDECVAHSHFFRALSNEIDKVSAKMNVRIDIVDNIGNWQNMDAMMKLVDDAVERRLAGFIFATSPYPLKGSAILEEPGVARVAVMSKVQLGIPGVWHDDRGVYALALKHFAESGCRRPAFLLPSGIFGSMSEYVLRESASYAMEVTAESLQQVDINYRAGITNLLRLMFSADRATRPDALWVGDDSILEQVSHALQAMGLNGRDDIRLASLANFPWPTASVLPVVRIGYEANRLLEICVASIQEQVAGRQPEAMTILPAVLDTEIDVHEIAT